MGEAPSTARHVVVLGAGPAGLATAHELSRHGAKTTVVERNGFVGGLCRTLDYKGYRFDLGGHRWFSKNEDLNTWFRRLMEGELVDVDRISRIFHDGVFYQYPIAISDVVRKTAPGTLAHAGASYALASLRYGLLNKPVRHIRDAFTAQFGAKLFDMFFRQYTEKVWGRTCEQLSADWVGQRSKGLSIRSVVGNALSRRPSQTTSLIEQFMYPRDGYMRISERMAEDITAADNAVRLNTSVTAITFHGPRNFTVHVDTADGAQTLSATDVVSTIPLGLLARSITPACGPKVEAAADALKFRDLITVNLVIDRAQVSTDTWLYVQDQDIVFGRLHEPKNWSPAMVPDAARTSLVLECFCFHTDAIWAASDDEIAARCIGDLADKLGFIKREEAIDWAVVRTRFAYPIYDLDYAANIAVVREYLDTFEGLEIAGRGGTFRYNNADHSIEMGLVLGRGMLGLGDGQRGGHMTVNTDSSYQELHTRDGLYQPVLRDSDTQAHPAP